MRVDIDDISKEVLTQLNEHDLSHIKTLLIHGLDWEAVAYAFQCGKVKALQEMNP